jgi:hypothetical protein
MKVFIAVHSLLVLETPWRMRLERVQTVSVHGHSAVDLVHDFVARGEHSVGKSLFKGSDDIAALAEQFLCLHLLQNWAVCNQSESALLPLDEMMLQMVAQLSGHSSTQMLTHPIERRLRVERGVVAGAANVVERFAPIGRPDLPDVEPESALEQ